MGKLQTSKSPYKSMYSIEPLYITPQAYIVETIISRQAKKENAELQNKFWELEKWKRTFFLQLRLANSLLKIYSAEAVIRALRTPQGKRIYSLSAKWLDDLCKIEQKKWDREQEALKTVPAPVSKTESATEPTKQTNEVFESENSILAKLRDL